jgi:hypothetical protein
MKAASGSFGVQRLSKSASHRDRIGNLSRMASGKSVWDEPRKPRIHSVGKSFDGWFRYPKGNYVNSDDTWQIESDGKLACFGKAACWPVISAQSNFNFAAGMQA